MQLFRKEAMQRVSSPEQLDQLMSVTNPVGWVALLITATVLLTITLWGFKGRLPVVTHGSGLLTQPDRVKGIFSPAAGQVLEVNVTQGQTVAKGTVVARLLLSSNFPDIAQVDVLASNAGRVAEVLTHPGNYVTPGERLINLSGESSELVAVLFVSLDEGKRVKVGMEARISPSTVKEDDYGFMLGHVRRVSSEPVSSAEMTELLGNPDLVAVFTGDGGVYQHAPIQVWVDLETDLNTPSGYKWSSRQGPNYGVTAGTFCQANIVTEVQRPIDLVIPYLKKIFGVPTWQ